MVGAGGNGLRSNLAKKPKNDSNLSKSKKANLA